MIELTDINSLEKENIKMEVNKNELNDISQKAIDVKNKIENEITNINKLYEETIDKLTKSFIIKHEKLVKEENDLKEQLQTKVTKKKEELENYLSIFNCEIKNSERIKKGIIEMEKEKEEKNMLKVLSYISNINKFMKKMKEIYSHPKQNLKFHYIEEENIIKYEDYYFSGIQAPKNIKYDIYASSIDIYWALENIDLKSNIIKFKVEMRKENEDYKNVYEGPNNNCEVNNLSKNTNYEFRICSSINNITGIWTEPYKIKTNELERNDSIILNNSKRKNEFSLKLLEWSGYKRMKLLFRGTRDGMNAQSFHKKCDNNGETIILIQNDKENIFGGYASIPWTSHSGSYFSAPDSFIFTLTNIYNTNPTKFKNKNDGNEVCHNRDYGPLFGYTCDIYISKDFINGETKSTFPETYIDVLGKGKSIFTGDSNNNNNKFKIKEIEVFKVIK